MAEQFKTHLVWVIGAVLRGSLDPLSDYGTYNAVRTSYQCRVSWWYFHCDIRKILVVLTATILDHQS